MLPEPKVTRPPLRYHGGKWLLAPWIISNFGPHRTYTDTYGGGASVLLRKFRSYAEVYNDINGEVVNLFRVLRNPSQARELMRLVDLTPYAREEFDASYILADDPVEQARRTLLRSAAGFSTTGAQADKWKTGFRGSVTRSGTTPAGDWATLSQSLEVVTYRLRGVVIENVPALDCLRKYDGPDVLHYLDPTYVADTRSERWAGRAYTFELSDDDHRMLAGILHELKGMVVLSGYASDLYDKELFAGWQRIERKTRADRALERTEVLWFNDAAWRGRPQGTLDFAGSQG